MVRRWDSEGGALWLVGSLFATNVVMSLVESTYSDTDYMGVVGKIAKLKKASSDEFVLLLFMVLQRWATKYVMYSIVYACSGNHKTKQDASVALWSFLFQIIVSCYFILWILYLNHYCCIIISSLWSKIIYYVRIPFLWSPLPKHTRKDPSLRNLRI